MAYWGPHILNGLSFGALLFLLSSGFTLAFGLMKVMNVAHGSFYMLGAYLSLWIFSLTGSFELSVIGAAILVGLLGMFSEKYLLRWFHL